MARIAVSGRFRFAWRVWEALQSILLEHFIAETKCETLDRNRVEREDILMPQHRSLVTGR
jgi:hypothetical protein